MGNISEKETTFCDEVELTSEQIEAYVQEQKIREQKKLKYYTQLLIDGGCNFYETNN